jgi:hypothetical protein
MESVSKKNQVECVPLLGPINEVINRHLSKDSDQVDNKWK